LPRTVERRRATLSPAPKHPGHAATVWLRLWSQGAATEWLDGQEVQKTFESFALWLESQTETGRLEVALGGRWWMVAEDGQAFHWSGRHFDKAPPRLTPKEPILDSPEIQGRLQVEAWKLITRHHDFFIKISLPSPK